MSSTTSNHSTQQHSIEIEDPSPLGIDPDTKFSTEIPVYDHRETSTFTSRLRSYDESDENKITLGNISQKAKAAFEVMQQSQAVIVEVEPWFVNKHMGTERFDRWEPFFVAFPEIATGRQMKVSNLAPLSEVAYRIRQRDTYLSEAESTDQNITYDATGDSEFKEFPPVVKAQIEEQRAFTRYSLDSFYNGKVVDEKGRATGAWVDMDPVHAIHTVLSPWPQHLIVGSRDDGSLYCGRGALFDQHVDVAIDLDRRINDHNERKVAVYNDKSKKDAMNSLSFEETHARYLGEKARWEVDMGAIETVIRDLLKHEDIEYVSLHRITEKAYVTHINPSFRTRVEGYPAFDR